MKNFRVSLLVVAALLIVVTPCAVAAARGGGGRGGGCHQCGLTVNAGDDVVVCAGWCTTLHAAAKHSCCCGGSHGTLVFSWQPTEGLSDPSSSDPTACPAQTTTYQVTVTVAGSGCGHHGCTCGQLSASDTVVVFVDDLVADAGPDQDACPGPVTIGGSPAASAGTPPYVYSWTPVDGLSDPAAANPTAAPAMTTVYTLAVTDAAGCTASSSTRVSACGSEPCAPRTIGYWKQQCEDQPKEDPYKFFSIVYAGSAVFDELTGADDPCSFLVVDFDPQGPDAWLSRALRQLAALWLNVATDKISLDTPVGLPEYLGGATSIGEAIADVEAIILAAPSGDDPSLETAKDIADALNNGCFYLEVCITGNCPWVLNPALPGGSLPVQVN